MKISIGPVPVNWSRKAVMAFYDAVALSSVDIVYVGNVLHAARSCVQRKERLAIARAILFNAQILIMDEPTAALGPQETTQVAALIKKLKADGLGIFLISHDIHDVFDLSDRICVMKNGRVVGIARVADVSKDDVLGMIILGKCPPGAIPGPAAMDRLGARAANSA